MKVIEARNVHQALPLAVEYLKRYGVRRESRNGPVLQSPVPVTTVYTHPCERVIFWPERDANPFFHLYESLWMLAGRNDVAGVARYAKQMNAYSDDGSTLHGAYGYRWRVAFDADQLPVIVQALKKNPEDRRCVLQMWDSGMDLGWNGKDVPCNVTATFQRHPEGQLDLTVFCRSNDIVWGAYGANAVHFSFLLEYMASAIGCPVGRYYQVSVNWHAYLETFEKVQNIGSDTYYNPYTGAGIFREHEVRPIPLPSFGGLEKAQRYLDIRIKRILDAADSDTLPHSPGSTWDSVVRNVLYAHQLYRNKTNPHRYDEGIAVLMNSPRGIDWVEAGIQWLERRKEKHERAKDDGPVETS